MVVEQFEPFFSRVVRRQHFAFAVFIIERFEEIVGAWIAAFDGRPGVRAWRQFPNEAGQPMPRCVVEVDRAITGLTGADLVSRLWESDPRIAVKQYGETGISMTPDTLADGDEHVVTERLLEIIAAGPGHG